MASCYAIIDPHCRNSDGTCAADGKSIVAFYPNIQSLIIYLMKLDASLNADNSPFEVTGVKVNMIENNERVSKE